MDGYAYDAAGDMTQDPTHNYTYDAENRISCVDNGAAVYQYDAEGRRVRKIIGASSCSATTGSTIKDYIYDLSARAITEVSGTGAWNRGEVYALGQHIATYTGGTSGTTYFDHADWLGTERARTNVNGALCESVTSLPFGDGESTTGSCGDPSPLHFTGKQRDTETNLDNFGARYNSSNLGRFMSADPDNAGASDSDPQSWNAYSYVQDNVLNATDPDGLDCINPLGWSSSGGLMLQVVRGDDCTPGNGGVYVNGTVDTSKLSLTLTPNSASVTAGFTPYGSSQYAMFHFSVDPQLGGDAAATGLANLVNADNPQGFVAASAKLMAENAAADLGGRLVGMGVEALIARRAATAAAEGAVDLTNLSEKIEGQMMTRGGWSKQDIVDTIRQAQEAGDVHDVPNRVMGGRATEYVSPSTGRFVVVDNASKQVIQVSGPGFKANYLVNK